ncbi:aspartyl/asparaginyl beta-hydroxylase domain-containing protein (plasmid) [Streptomyces sp. NBC_01591]|uniref:aspartyl/asparaginyl beta-hydroxylase domain-containing protein n=1 Tax=Streptomyces sp. NBC_01591 TaxID=2975888 RepID=UPI002DD862CB|nr:aspartyl/asparaginyl beta-hydroxylase domain-containing protein [Streptomyces sp. NBC_01591]WSD66110.1 aspartyl/asparaginyl beta-hydroxylase domain-containing protein [Streptomyces sp. NBC_01591]WSD73007.1 aspartyl/asparaginyl beta-hydroxylase domain-containing protein [Streptomyces sp. NBC_01591]WSD73716.1 aspartyl/asparaginyl beta-hydroxylase domain-containing protein [Streptomyces sp. NBC_01591]WSD74496.1 aspartyl/asparaginyl beta-hydroxylase domain-containing protein [Streptomyces sp. NB
MVTILPAATPVAQAGPGRADVLAQVARLADLDELTVEQMRAEALAAPARGVVAYGEYQSGGWWTTSLLNHSGDPHDVVIGDGRPRPTSLLEAMPATTRFLDGLGLDFMYVRLARLEPHSYLWEHRDYAELRDMGRHRLHIPLVTNPSAVLVTAGTRVHMAAGALWRLTPSQAHGVCNTTGPDRLHLIADVYANDAYQALAARPCLRDGDAADLPEMTGANRAALLSGAGQLAELGFTDAAEQTLLRAFYSYALPEGGAYDLIAELHTGRGADSDAHRWRQAKAHLLDRP